MNGEFSLSDLARQTGTEPRTIRSYIAEGLLRGPDAVGRNARYSRHHCDRLCAIRVLRDQERLGLGEIRRRFLTLRMVRPCVARGFSILAMRSCITVSGL